MSLELLSLQEEQLGTPFNKDLDEITKLQAIFDSNLNRKSNGEMLSYNPVLERWQFEKLQTELDEIHFRAHEERQVKTALKERMFTAKSFISYKIDGSSAYNELFPNEPFNTVLERGIAYRKSIGSVETERESSELVGWGKVFDNLLDPETPVGTKFIAISPPGIIEKTAYDHNFIDIYEKTETESGQVVIGMTRFASRTDYEKYKEIVLVQDMGYFDGFSGPIDAWFLAHPVPVSSDQNCTSPENIFESIFESNVNSMTDEVFEKIVVVCMPLILNYIDVLCQDDFDPKQVAIAFNAVLNKADIEKQFYESNTKTIYQSKHIPIFRDIKQEAYYLGTIPVQKRKVGCGLSQGFGTDSNSVAQFANEGSDEDAGDNLGPREVVCPACGHVNIRPFGKLLSTCQGEGCTKRDAIMCGA